MSPAQTTADGLITPDVFILAVLCSAVTLAGVQVLWWLDARRPPQERALRALAWRVGLGPQALRDLWWLADREGLPSPIGLILNPDRLLGAVQRHAADDPDLRRRFRTIIARVRRLAPADDPTPTARTDSPASADAAAPRQSLTGSLGRPKGGSPRSRATMSAITRTSS